MTKKENILNKNKLNQKEDHLLKKKKERSESYDNHEKVGTIGNKKIDKHVNFMKIEKKNIKHSDNKFQPTQQFQNQNKKINNYPNKNQRKNSKNSNYEESNEDSEEEIKTKKFQKMNMNRPKLPCQYYVNGACNKGTNCTFSHDVPQIKKEEMCKYFLAGNCMKGSDCLFSHNLGLMPCKFFHAIGCCVAGVNCKFSHNRLNEEEIFKFIEQNEDFIINLYKSNGQTNMDDYLRKFYEAKNQPFMLESFGGAGNTPKNPPIGQNNFMIRNLPMQMPIPMPMQMRNNLPPPMLNNSQMPNPIPGQMQGGPYPNMSNQPNVNFPGPNNFPNANLTIPPMIAQQQMQNMIKDPNFMMHLMKTNPMMFTNLVSMNNQNQNIPQMNPNISQQDQSLNTSKNLLFIILDNEVIFNKMNANPTINTKLNSVISLQNVNPFVKPSQIENKIFKDNTNVLNVNNLNFENNIEKKVEIEANYKSNSIGINPFVKDESKDPRKKKNQNK